MGWHANRRTQPCHVAAGDGVSVGTDSARGEVRGLAEGPNGHFWAATSGGGVHHGSLEELAPLTGVPALDRSPFLSAGLRMTRGDLYFAGPTQVFRREAGTGVVRTLPMAGETVTALCEDADGSLLLGTREGMLKRMADGVVQPVPNGNFSSPVVAIVRGKRPGVWVATVSAGLFHWDSGNVEHWTTAEGLPTNLLRSLHEDAEGTLWIGTGGGGLAWLRDGRVQVADTRRGLMNDAISPILEDDDGNLWLGSIRGISRISKRELFDVAAGRAAAVHPLALDESDGMPSAECTSGYCPAGIRSQSGLLLFSTTRHIVAVDPKRFTSATTPPNMLIESVIACRKIVRASC